MTRYNCKNEFSWERPIFDRLENEKRLITAKNTYRHLPPRNYGMGHLKTPIKTAFCSAADLPPRRVYYYVIYTRPFWRFAQRVNRGGRIGGEKRTFARTGGLRREF
jgi:hypothetical protein